MNEPTESLAILRDHFASSEDVPARVVIELLGTIIHWNTSPPHTVIVAKTGGDGITELCFLMEPVSLGPYATWGDVRRAFLEASMMVKMSGWNSVDETLRSFETVAAEFPPEQRGLETILRLDVLRYTDLLTREEIQQALKSRDADVRRHALGLLDEFKVKGDDLKQRDLESKVPTRG